MKVIDTYIMSYKDNTFLGVITYSKNIVGHYNDHNPPVHLLTYEIIALADELFLGRCSMIRNAMAELIFIVQGLSKYLSKERY